MKTQPIHTRTGFALPVTLFALVAIGAIVTGGFYVSAQENRISMSTDLGQQAFSVAEYGLEEVLGTWKNRDIMALASSGAARTEDAWAGSRQLGEYEVSIDSLGGRLYLIRVAGTATRGARSATRLIGGIGRTTNAGLPYESAMTVLGQLSVEGRSTIDGTDLCDPTSVLPGVTTPSEDNVTQSGNADVQGEPPVDPEPDMNLEKLSQFGDVSLEELIKSATHIYPPNANPTNMQPVTTTDGGGNTICDTSVQNNWGDTASANPCGDHYPLIYAQGDFQINGAGQGGMGQGILIVEGDLIIDGNIQFQGVVITKGDLYYAGNGGHVEGSVIVMGDGSSTSAGSSVAGYDSCIVEDVFNGALRMRPLSARSWVDLGAMVRPPSGS